MLQQIKILLMALIFHFVHSNTGDDFDSGSTTSDKSCTEPDKMASESNCYCYSQPETDFEYSICAKNNCPLEDANYRLIHGKCFYFGIGFMNFEDARESCKQKGGKLYEPKDKDIGSVEMVEIVKILNHDWAWIGITDTAKEGNYVYSSNGLRIDFNPFWCHASGDRGTSFNCITVMTQVGHRCFGQFHASTCHSTKSSICEL